jgi:hypothetical protein
MDSAMGFMANSGQKILGLGLEQKATIAQILHANGYGTENTNYESDLVSVIDRVVGTSKCPGR